MRYISVAVQKEASVVVASAVSCLLIGSDRRDGDPHPPKKKECKFLGFVKPHGASEKPASSNCFKGIPFHNLA